MEKKQREEREGSKEEEEEEAGVGCGEERITKQAGKVWYDTVEYLSR